MFVLYYKCSFRWHLTDRVVHEKKQSFNTAAFFVSKFRVKIRVKSYLQKCYLPLQNWMCQNQIWHARYKIKVLYTDICRFIAPIKIVRHEGFEPSWNTVKICNIPLFQIFVSIFVSSSIWKRLFFVLQIIILG